MMKQTLASAAASIALTFSLSPSSHAFTSIHQQHPLLRPPTTNPSPTKLHNLLNDLTNLITNNGSVEPETSLPYHPPFSDIISIHNQERTFAIRERAITFTGEDFDILDISDGNSNEFVRVRGAMLHLPGKDKMRLSSSDGTHVTMDRVLIAATPSYDLYRHEEDGSTVKIGWIEKKLISLMDTFDVYMEGKGGFGVTGLFKPTPAYRIEGDFLDRNFR
jgi:hypothetical protein